MRKNKSFRTGIAATAVLLALAACSKNPKPKDLPPPPPTAATAPSDMAPSGPANGAALPGSRADFLAQVGVSGDTVHFASDSSDVDDQAKAILTQQVAWLRKYPNVHVTVEGHCDERGTREYNLALGDRRANSAKDFLVNAGIDAARLSVISYGKERPLSTGSDDASWAQDRRAVTVVPR